MQLLRVACLAAIVTAPACGGESSAADESSSSSTGAPEPIPCAEDMPCPDPSGQVCLVGQCHDGIAPVLEIVSPAQYESAAWTPGGETTELSVTVRVEGFQIVDPAIDPTNVRAAGNVVLELDGVEVATITEGDAGDGVTVSVPAAATAGGHRLAAHLNLSDGTPYDHPEAATRRFFWFADGQPHVGIVTPWSGDTFTTGEQPVEVTVAVVDFQLVPASAEQSPGATGLVHTFNDADFPTCGEDPTCAAAYNDVIAPESARPTALGAVLLPPAPADTATTLTALLAHSDHEPYCGEGAAACPAIFDEVELPRVAPDAGE
jgi:hypothetical protein